MSQKTKTIEIALRDLKAPGEDLLGPSRDVDYQYWLPANKNFLTEEYAERLNRHFPLTVYGQRNEVIGNKRTFEIMIAVFGGQSDKKIWVRKIVNTNLSQAKLKEMLSENQFMAISCFSGKDAVPSLYAFIRIFRKLHPKKFDFFKPQSVRSMAEMFGISTNTLQKIVRRMKKNEKA